MELRTCFFFKKKKKGLLMNSRPSNRPILSLLLIPIGQLWLLLSAPVTLRHASVQLPSIPAPLASQSWGFECRSEQFLHIKKLVVLVVVKMGDNFSSLIIYQFQLKKKEVNKFSGTFSFSLGTPIGLYFPSVLL